VVWKCRRRLKTDVFDTAKRGCPSRLSRADRWFVGCGYDFCWDTGWTPRFRPGTSGRNRPGPRPPLRLPRTHRQDQTCRLPLLIGVARRSAVKAKTQCIKQIRGMLVSGPSDLREQMKPLGTTALIQALSRLHPDLIFRHRRQRQNSRCVPWLAATWRSVTRSKSSTSYWSGVSAFI
jgi:hypothetical protein